MSWISLLSDAAIVGLLAIPMGFAVLFQSIKYNDKKFLWAIALGYFLIGSFPYFVYEAAMGLSGLWLFVGAAVVGVISIGIGFVIFIGSTSLYFGGCHFMSQLLDFRGMVVIFFINGALPFLLYQLTMNTILPSLATYKVCCHCHWC
jgi:hypothetical protein